MKLSFKITEKMRKERKRDLTHSFLEYAKSISLMTEKVHGKI
jgi:hypothetical protein